MKTNQKITLAIMTALGAHATAALAADSDASDSSALQEVTVTATRRSESIQNVPLSIQAITGEQLQQLNVTTFDDVIKLVPNVTFGSIGPGQGEIFMRGMSSGAAGGQSTGTFSPFPNVAVYLDDQSLQFPGHNLDVYMVDMERIEVLEGPQGTLFGGGAQAGAIRYITNKPKLDKTEGDVEASYGVTAGGDPNHAVNATLNVPIIDGVFALRGTIYSDHHGGYIDNVPSKFQRVASDPAIANYTSSVPAYNINGDNFQLARDNQNPVDYGGARLSGLWKVNDDWSVLVAQSYQDMEADGTFQQFPYGSNYQADHSQVLGPDQGTFFTDAVDKDKVSNTSLTINGKVGDFSLVYTGGYLDRHVEQISDYTNYARSGGGGYYACTGGSFYFTTPTSTTMRCYSPVMSWHDKLRNTHLSNEFRVSTPDDWRLRGIAGVYHEKYIIDDNMNFYYRSMPSCTPENLAAAAQPDGPLCVGATGPAPGTAGYDPNTYLSVPTYGQNVHRGYKQIAAFTSLDFDIIPKVLTITAGTRYYHYDEFENGSRYITGNGCDNTPDAECAGTEANIVGYPTDPALVPNFNPTLAANYKATYSGFKSRGNLTWHITPDHMAYFTWSQGFRPGGFNRVPVNKANDAEGNSQYSAPIAYDPDTVTNLELGWKTSWFEHRLQFNGSVYQMDWKNVQFTLFDPPSLGNTTFVENGPNYRIKGIEIQLVARPIDGLTLTASSSWNSPEQTSAPCLVHNNPASTETPLGSCITEVKGNPYDNPYGALDTRPAFSPPWQFSVNARYEWRLIKDYNAFVQVGASHIGEQANEPASYLAGATTPDAVTGDLPVPSTTHLRYEMPGYTTYDASLGVTKDAWTVTVYGQNLSNSDASTFTNSGQYILAETPLRPRVLGAKVDYRF